MRVEGDGDHVELAGQAGHFQPYIINYVNRNEECSPLNLLKLGD